MATFAPEFAHHWSTTYDAGSEQPAPSRDDDHVSPAQREALEALAERVLAARTIV
jgi:hypothetical protein